MLDDNLILIMCACFGSLSHGEREGKRWSALGGIELDLAQETDEGVSTP